MRRLLLRAFFGAILSLVALLQTNCAKRESAAPAPSAPEPRVLRISQRNEPADLDPARATLPDEFFIIRALSEGLVTPRPLHAAAQAPASVEPAAATHWEVSADGLVYTFHLRPAARWSNSEPVTARDFVESYRRVLTPATAAPKANLFFMVRNARAFATGAHADFSTVGFRAADPHTLVVTLEHPMPQFLAYAASGPWIPINPRVVAGHGREWTRPEHFVGNGPFTLTEWRPHQRIVVRRRADHHAGTHAKVDEIQFIAFDSGDTEERAFRAGQIDLTMSVPFSKLDAYARERPDELHRAPLAETRFISFNTTRAPLDDVRVRRAFALAIDRAKITEAVLRGGHEPAFTFVPPMLYAVAADAAAPADRVSTSADMTFDPGRARRLLAEAGFPDGRGFPRLELSTWGVTPQVIEALQQMWRKELGVQVALVTREARVHMAALREGRYDLGFITAIPDLADPAHVLEELVSGAAGNYPRWSDPAFDTLMAKAAREPNALRQQTLLRSAEARLLKQCPLAPVYFNAINWLMSPRVRGWQPDALWTRFYLHVELTEPLPTTARQP
jgi:oligopeptide transport system substrate-binding protein